MDAHAHHSDLVKGLAEQMSPVFEKSHQGLVIYLDDDHKACNGRFAKMLGYEADEWAKVDTNFLETFIAPEDRDAVMENYHQPFASQLSASTLKVRWLTKDGRTVESTMIHVPVAFDGHLVAVMYVTPA
jgi:PAS domain S-box-containing protein